MKNSWPLQLAPTACPGRSMLLSLPASSAEYLCTGLCPFSPLCWALSVGLCVRPPGVCLIHDRLLEPTTRDPIAG